MKKITILNSLLIAITSTFISINTNAQTLVNREWVTTGGNPNEHFEYISGAGANGFIYIVGSTYRSNQQDNFFIAKIVDDGTIYWIKEFNSLTDYRDFGIDIVAKDTLIYVTGMSWDSISGTSKIVTLRLDDNNGNIVWAQSWGSRYNVPVKITADNNGNVYVGGTAETSASEFAMVVLKYSPSGSLDWASTYDSIGVIDGAVALVLDSPQNYLTITGYSGNGFNNWDFTTVQMDVSTGNIKNTTITQNGNGGFNKPVGISGNGTTTYIGGTVTHPTTGKKRMKIIGYDYQWQEVNLSYYGDSLTETEAVDMHNDYTGANVLLATHTRTDGHKEIIVARYALSDGSLLWDRTLSAPSGEDAEAGSFTIAGDANNIYLTGSIKSSSGRHRMLTAAYDLDGNLMWMKEYNRTATSDDRGKTVDADVDGNPVTTGVSIDNDTSTYVSVKYTQKEVADNVVFDNLGNPKFMQEQVIVRLNRNALNISAVEDLDKQFFTPSDILTKEADSIIQANLSIDLKNCKLLRICKKLSPKCTTSLTRQGDNIAMPDFWTAFILEYPSPNNRSEENISQMLTNCFPTVKYAHPNYVGELTATANDSLYLMQQHSLHAIAPFISANVNIEDTWNIETGKDFVKVGLMGSGIDWRHSDFGYDGINQSSSKVKDGWDYYHNESPFNQVNPDTPGHETAAAGIIGAIRNNGKGIAGIAGGNNNSPVDNGVSLYEFAIARSGGILLNAANVYEALIEAVSENSSTQFGYGVHILNNSWGIDRSFNIPNTTPPYLGADSNIALIRDATHWANRNGTIMVCARGNKGNYLYGDSATYPASYNDDWVISVGGTGITGEYKTSSSGSDNTWSPSRGQGIDVAAPCGIDLIRSLKPNNGYDNFAGTSFATPHVSGLAALLLSYLNSPNPSDQNLSPEDVEFIIQKTAIDTDIPGYDKYTGFGRIDISAAINEVKKPLRKVKHLLADSTTAKTLTLVASNDTIFLKEQFDEQTGDSIVEGKYIADIYKISAIVSNNLLANEQIINYWTRGSASNTFQSIDVTNNLYPYEASYLSNVTHLNSSVNGYVYKIRDLNNSFSKWLPFDTTQIKSRMAFSLLVQDNNYNNLETIDYNESQLQIYPNPSKDKAFILFETIDNSETEINLIDISGRYIKNYFKGISPSGVNTQQLNTNELNEGIYIVEIRTNNTVKHIKLVKQ